MKSNICLWKDLLLSDVQELWNCSSRDDVKKKLCSKLNFDFHNLLSKDKILLDLHFHTMLFAKQRNYNEEQTSSLFSIIKNVHEKAVETPFGNIEDTLAYFKELLACHSVKRPPFCIYLFSVAEVVAITEYVANTYFRHYKLYKYAFTPKIVMNVVMKYADAVEEDIPVDTGAADGLNSEAELEAADGNLATETEEEEEDSPAIKELKQIIGSTLEEEIAKLKYNFEEKLKMNEENILKQLGNSKDIGTPSNGKRSTTKMGKKKK